MTEDDVHQLITSLCDTAGSQAAWAKQHKMSPAYVSDVINRRRGLSKRMLKTLGIERIITYRKIEK